MNPEIILDDYQSIGTMETALSEHADEAFFELSGEGQKTAEKIFKCLTETDRENREIRRAMTVEKLCAVAEADFSEVAEVVEIFRREGRTFLMPPPDVRLNENSLVDISHESLIRKWERLKKWVEEEGQSARTYRRLAEDALLHQQNKMGFWSDPELKDALEWRENFKPNETWAQLYKETGEKQYKATFTDAMRYLDESEINRDEEIAEDKRQQEALKSSAVKVRRAAIALLILFLASLGVAGFAFLQRAEAVKQKAEADRISGELRVEKNLAVDTLDKLKLSETEKTKAFDDLKIKTGELETKQIELTDSLKIAEDQKARADKEARQAILSEGEKQKALVRQKQLADAAEIAKLDALDKERAATQALARLEASTEREFANRIALIYLEQGQMAKASDIFEDLLTSYKNEGEPMEEKLRIDGKWWASHNLGIANSKLGNYDKAHESYTSALNTLFDAPKTDKTRETELNRSIVTTYRRLAQLYREQAQNATNEKDIKRFNLDALETYANLIEVLEKEPGGEKQKSYPADVNVEFADTLYDLADYKAAQEHYKMAEETYAKENDYDKQVEVLKKWADAALSKDENDFFDRSASSVQLLKKALEIQEDEKKMNLSPVSLEIAETYDQLAKTSIYTGQYLTDDERAYEKLFPLIRKMDYTVNKTDDILSEEVKNLADTYLTIGKCRKAEKVYLYALERKKSTDQQGRNFLNTFIYLYVNNDLAELYLNFLDDKDNAGKYYDIFYEDTKIDEETKVGKADGHIFNENMYIKAGDFYFAQRDFTRAGELYKHALKIIEDGAGEDYKYEGIDENNKDRILRLIVVKAEILAKTAQIFEAQSNPSEAQNKYLEALNLIKSHPETMKLPMAARAFIYLADFYARNGDKVKAGEIYTEAELILKASTKFPAETFALQSQILKNRGDIIRDTDSAKAETYYKDANTALRYYKDKRETGDEFPAGSIFFPYTRNGEVTIEYETALFEILKARSTLKGANKKEELDREQKALEYSKNYRCNRPPE